MRSNRMSTVVLAALLLSVPPVSCATNPKPPASSLQPGEQTFLDILSGPYRDKYSDSDLLEEGHKVCDAYEQGMTEAQARKMIQTDLGLEPGQFIGALDGGLLCSPKS